MDSLVGREQETARLVDLLRGPGPSLSVVRGLPGIGVTTLLARVVAGSFPETGEREVVTLTVPSLPAPDLRALLAARIGGLSGARPLPPDAGWADTLGALAGGGPEERVPRVVVLDDVHHLVDARSGLAADLLGLWTTLRSHGLPVHLVLGGRDPRVGAFLAGAPPELGAAVGLDLRLRPLDAPEVASLLPSWAPAERLRAWAVFGGLPDRVRRIDPTVDLATNVRRLMLGPDAPLLKAGQELLAREVQSLARYASLVRGLALGARDWGELRRACPDVAGGSQMAPYLGRLEEAGWVEARRSLDAKPGSRSRRYELTDPFPGFWFRFVLPRLADLTLGETGRYGGRGDGGDGGGRSDPWAELVTPTGVAAGGAGAREAAVAAGGTARTGTTPLDAHVALHLPRALRGWALRHGGRTLGAPAREAGGLWGDGYDLPVAGTLRTGAVFYGHAHWPGSPADDRTVDAVEAELRNTRYGFGKERRLRVVFTGGGIAPDGARRAARDDRVILVGTEDLVGV